MLSQPVDAADALLQALRCPGELQIDDETATVVEIESFACGVRCEEQRRVARRELPKNVQALARGKATVQLQWCEAGKRSGEMMQRVAVLGEHQDRLTRAVDLAPDRIKLALVQRCGPSELRHLLKPSTFFESVAKAGEAELLARFIVRVALDEGERQLVV